MNVESVAAAEACDEDACRVNVIASIGGTQFTGADDVTIELTYVVIEVDGVALVNDVLK